MTAVSAVNPQLNFPSCAGGSVDIYLAGTTTRSNTWQDRNQTTLNTNPIVLNARGECVAWLDSSKRYKFVVKNSSGVTIYTADNVTGAQSGSATLTQFTTDTFSGTGAQTAFTLSVTPSHENTTNVFVGGVYQQKNAYSVVGTTLTFSVAPVLGTNNVEVVTAAVIDYTDVAEDVTASMNAAAASATAAAASATAADASADAAALSEAQAAAIVLGNFLQEGTGAVSRTFTAKAREMVSILDFIPVAEHAAIKARTSTYNCYADIVASIASVSYDDGVNLRYVSGPAIYFPPGKYICNSRIELKKTVRLYGDTSGLQYDRPAEISFPAGTAGIVVNAHNTLNDATEAVPTTSADTTIIEGLLIRGNGGAAAHGIRLRGRALLRNCFVYGFSGNGIHITAAAGLGGALEGNANLFRIEGGTVEANGANGLFVDGPDANAGIVTGLNAMTNGGWGIYDSSFLGNTYIGCHTAGNTLGPYKSDDANARNVFIGCYSESDQPPSSISPPSLVIGGLHGAGVTASTPFLQAQTAGFASNVNMTLPSIILDSGVDTSGDNLVFPDTQGIQSWALSRAVGRIGFTWANSGIPGHLMFYDRTASVANGYARNIADSPAGNFGTMGMDVHFFGSPSQMRYRGLAIAAPLSGEYLQGDRFDHLLPVAGGTIGWVCVASGNPGTWKTFGAIAA